MVLSENDLIVVAETKVMGGICISGTALSGVSMRWVLRTMNSKRTTSPTDGEYRRSARGSAPAEVTVYLGGPGSAATGAAALCALAETGASDAPARAINVIIMGTDRAIEPPF